MSWWASTQGLDARDVAVRKQFGERLRSSLGSEPERQLFATYFRHYLPILGVRLPALIPQVYLHYDPVHLGQLRARGEDRRFLVQRMDFLLLLRHRARVVVEIDGQQHSFGDNKRRRPQRTESGATTTTFNVGSTGGNPDLSVGVSLWDPPRAAAGGGSATLVKTGPGFMQLNGASMYSGGTTVSAGTLQINNAAALGSSSGPLAANGGVLDLSGYSPTVGPLSGAAGTVLTSSGGATLTTNMPSVRALPSAARCPTARANCP